MSRAGFQSPESTPALLQSLPPWCGQFPGAPLRGTPGFDAARLRRLRARIYFVQIAAKRSWPPTLYPLTNSRRKP